MTIPTMDDLEREFEREEEFDRRMTRMFCLAAAVAIVVLGCLWLAGAACADEPVTPVGAEVWFQVKQYFPDAPPRPYVDERRKSIADCLHAAGEALEAAAAHPGDFEMIAMCGVVQRPRGPA